MLVLSRRVGEQIVLPNREVTITVVAASGNKVRLGITAPAETAVHRGEVWHRIHGSCDAPSEDSGEAGRGPVQEAKADGQSSSNPTTSELEQRLACAITKRTRGRVCSLRVHILGERVVLRGCAESYHAIQLAQAGLLEAMDAMEMDRPGLVELDVDMVPGSQPLRP